MSRFVTYNRNGGVQLDTDTITYGFVSKGTATFTTQAGQDRYGRAIHSGFVQIENLPKHQIVVSRCATCSLGLRNITPYEPDTQYDSISMFPRRMQNSSATTHTLEYWLFNKYKFLPDTPGSLRLYSRTTQGEITFNASYPPLQIVGRKQLTSIPDDQKPGPIITDFYNIDYQGRTIAYCYYGLTYIKFANQGGDLINGYGPIIGHGTNGIYVNSQAGLFLGGPNASTLTGGVLLIDVTGL